MRERGSGHVVNIVTWGVQLKAPKFSAYIASKTALDAWSRVAGRETWADGVTFTSMRFGLVATAMTAPTEAYAGRGASPEQAAARVVRALEERPVLVSTLAGNVGEVLNLVAPRLTDVLFARADRASPTPPPPARPTRPADGPSGTRRTCRHLTEGPAGQREFHRPPDETPAWPMKLHRPPVRFIGRPMNLPRLSWPSWPSSSCWRLLGGGLLGGGLLRAGFFAASSSPRSSWPGSSSRRSVAGRLLASSDSSESSSLSRRPDLAASTERCSAASRSTTSPEDLVEVGVRFISPPSILVLTIVSTAAA